MKLKFNTFCISKMHEGPHIFEVLEDPDDGYRSMLDEVRYVESADAKNLIFGRTVLATVKIVEVKDTFRGGFKLVDNEDGHVWLEFGTDCNDEYYPCFFFTYVPKEPAKQADVESTQDFKVGDTVALNVKGYEDLLIEFAHADERINFMLKMAAHERTFSSPATIVEVDTAAVPKSYMLAWDVPGYRHKAGDRITMRFTKAFPSTHFQHVFN